MTSYAQDLSAHRLNKAKDVLRQAELLLNHHEYDGSINRSYYAIFSQIAHNAFDSRQVHDYQDFQVLTPEQAKAQFDDAASFIQEIEQKQALLIQGEIPLPHISESMR